MQWIKQMLQLLRVQLRKVFAALLWISISLVSRVRPKNLVLAASSRQLFILIPMRRS